MIRRSPVSFPPRRGTPPIGLPERVPAMLVFLQPGTAQSAIEAVRRRAVDAGLDCAVFEETDPVILHLTGDNPDEAADEIALIPGVARVARAQRSTPPVTSNLRIAGIRPLVPPAILMEQLPLPPAGAVTVHRTRQELRRILAGTDDRLIVVVGPCSIHDAGAAQEYARRLASLAEKLTGDLRIV